MFGLFKIGLNSKDGTKLESSFAMSCASLSFWPLTETTKWNLTDMAEVSLISELVKGAAKFLRKHVFETESGHERRDTEVRRHYLAAFSHVLCNVFQSTPSPEGVAKQLVE